MRSPNTIYDPIHKKHLDRKTVMDNYVHAWQMWQAMGYQCEKQQDELKSLHQDIYNVLFFAYSDALAAYPPFQRLVKKFKVINEYDLELIIAAKDEIASTPGLGEVA